MSATSPNTSRLVARLMGDASPLETLWRRYLAARDAAEKSRDMRDGIAAGRAWRVWLTAFEGAPYADG